MDTHGRSQTIDECIPLMCSEKVMCNIGTAAEFDTKYFRRCANNKNIRKKCDKHFKHEFKSKGLINYLKNSTFHFLFR